MPLFIPLLNYLMKPDISMRNFYLFVFLFASINLFGQNTRYLDDVFNSVNKTTLEYSSVYGLDMDGYEPVGDSETNRPLIILAHGGSFVAGSTPLGGGVIAFPVSVLFLRFTGGESRHIS